MPRLSCYIPQTVQNALEARVSSTGASISHIVTEFLSQSLDIGVHTLFQISTTGALVEGVYEKAVSSKYLLNHGDFGLGTFEHLDGEMVVLDGQIYQTKADGICHKVTEDVGTPFAVVLFFNPDKAWSSQGSLSYKEIVEICDQHRDSANVFYAFRITGRFKSIVTRAMQATEHGVRLASAAAHQPEFNFTDAEGTLAGIWSPRFSTNFNVAGYHFHFLSEDRTKGGHLLDCLGENLHFQVERITNLHLSLPESEEYLRADLSRDASKDLEYAEQMHNEEKS
jgi:acetolactate decarboxylase